VLEDHSSGDWPVGVPDQIFKQQKFFRPQIDGLSQARNSSPDQIQLKIAGAEHIDGTGSSKIGGCLTQAYRKTKAHRQLRCKEWLTHAIVDTRFEKLQTLFQVKVSRKDKEGGVRVLLSQQLHQEHDIPKNERI
jgi:hypothetical protein